MANVGDRAQVLLMAALGMAILFVALALILNTAIYTENLATRGSEIAGGGDAIRYLDTVESGIGGTIGYVNRHNNSNHVTLQRNLSTAVPAWANSSRHQFVHRGRTVDVSITGTKNGTRIGQEAPNRNFSDNGWNETWTLAENVNGTREFRILVSDDSSLVEASNPDPFNVTVGNGSHQWRMNVSRNTSNTGIVVGIRNASDGEALCRAGGNQAWINVTGGEVGGENCNHLVNGVGIEPPYNVTFNNGSAIQGNYTFIVDNSTLANDPGSHLNGDRTSPYAEHATYSVNLSVTYQTPRLLYESSVRAAPGEIDE